MDLDTLYREERPRALATLIRLLGDFDLAEDGLQEAFAAALEQWPAAGVPRNARAWLVSTARHKAIDRLRRDKSLAAKQAEIAYLGEVAVPAPGLAEQPFTDDLMRLIFTCCHPALALEAQVALTLKTLCGLSVDEIARAFLVPPSTMAQRLVRAKAKIRGARIPYEVPGSDQLAERLDGVLRVVYLVFNEGYAATSGDALVRRELCNEAIRLGRLLRTLFPDASEVAGLLALTLLHDSRRAARLDERISSPWRNRTARGGTAGRSPRATRSPRPRCGGEAPASTRFRRRSPRCTRRRCGRARRTGRRSRRCTRSCSACTRRRSWLSTMRRRWQWGSGSTAACA